MAGFAPATSAKRRSTPWATPAPRPWASTLLRWCFPTIDAPWWVDGQECGHDL